MRLIDADSVSEIITRLIEEQKRLHNSDEVIGLMEAITEINNAPTVPRYGQWISVEDQLPERGRPVLALVAGKDWGEPAVYFDIDMLKNDGFWGLHYLDVMYWTSLPEAPKEGGKDAID